jgi:hypothetical protein
MAFKEHDSSVHINVQDMCATFNTQINPWKKVWVNRDLVLWDCYQTKLDSHLWVSTVLLDLIDRIIILNIPLNQPDAFNLRHAL